MKVLTIEAAFELSDWFKGDVPVALRLMADYIDAHAGEQMPQELQLRAFCPEVWDRFRAMPIGHRACIAAAISDQPQRTQQPPAAAEENTR